MYNGHTSVHLNLTSNTSVVWTLLCAKNLCFLQSDWFTSMLCHKSESNFGNSDTESQPDSRKQWMPVMVSFLPKQSTLFSISLT